ncbi:MAG: IS66 family insertion sequence element accessory protein TnpB [Myxococcales bacterium]|nr:IS66 family insertion sequence element accessory protein TnpB [Myxococcales bacterium]
MIPAGMQVFVALEPVDMRFGFERLSGLVRERIGYEPRSGALFVFVGKRRETVKILFSDGSGMCLFYKRLDRSTFSLPAAPEGTTHIEIDDVVLEALLDGIDLTSTPPPSSSPPKKKGRRTH